MREPLSGHLLTPQNAALLLIDNQPSRLAAGVVIASALASQPAAP